MSTQVTQEERAVLLQAFHNTDTTGARLNIERFRITNKNAIPIIERLLGRRLLAPEREWYRLTLGGLYAADDEGPRDCIRTFNAILPVLASMYEQAGRNKEWTVRAMIEHAQRSFNHVKVDYAEENELARALWHILPDLPIIAGLTQGAPGEIEAFHLAEEVLTFQPLPLVKDLSVFGSATAPLAAGTVSDTTPSASPPLPGSAGESISLAAENDEPTPQDELGFKMYAQAIARFLMSDRTKAPLTLSIEGPWGSGKSSFLLQIQEALGEYEAGRVPRERRWSSSTRVPRVQFNAWRHDKDQSLWAAFLLDFVRELRQSTSWWRRIWALVLTWFTTPGAVFELLRVVFQVVVWLSLAVAVGFVTISGGTKLVSELAAQASRHLGGEVAGDTATSILNVVVHVGGPAGAVIVVLMSVFKLGGELLGNPFENKLKELLRRPEYEDGLPSIERFHKKFCRLVDTYVGAAGKVFVFIDDLDRCDPVNTAALMKALNLLISNDRRLVFVLAIDRAKIAAGIAHQYAAYVHSLTEAGSPDAIDFGHSYLEKFIQLGFRLPEPSSDALTRFVRALAGEPQARPPRRSSDPSTQGPVQNPPLEKVASPTITSPPASARDRQYVALGLDGDSNAIQKLALFVARQLDANPRRVKQFLNAFRLRAFIAVETGLLDEVEGVVPLTLAQLAKIVAIQMTWPRFVDDWLADPELVKWLMEYHLKSPPDARLLRWSEQTGLIDLLTADLDTEPSKRTKVAPPFDLSRVDIRRILAVTSPVPRPSVHVKRVPDEPPRSLAVLDERAHASDKLEARVSQRQAAMPASSAAKEPDDMSPVAKALWTALVAHLEAAKQAHPVGARVVIPAYLVTYGDLIRKAKVPIIPAGIGPYLSEIAEECQRQGWKPLNALAVSQKSDGSPGVPGDSYDGAGGFLLRDWDKDVSDAIRTTYPLVPGAQGGTMAVVLHPRNDDLRQRFAVAKQAAGSDRNSSFVQQVLNDARSRVNYLRGVLT